jgi:hypothetical protein
MFFLKKSEFLKLSTKEIKEIIKLFLIRAYYGAMGNAIKDFVSFFYKFFDKEGFSVYGTHFKVNNKLFGNDAMVAFLAFREYYISNLPFWRRLIARLLKLPRVVYISPERVSFIPPFYKRCPMLSYKELPLDRVKVLCERLFERECFARPDVIHIVKSINPCLKWKLQKFRDKRNGYCVYSIVYEGQSKFQYNPELIRELKKYAI